MITDEDMYSLRIQLQKTQITNELFPPTPLLSFSIYNKLDLDQLFTIFYFSDDKYLRFLAAKELKRREWKFNKKYLIWFMRHGQPIE